MELLRLVSGLALLVMGRRLFWLFLGGVGFVLGFDFAKMMVVRGQPEGVIFVIALLAGAIGALVAIFLQRFAVLAGGFLAGGYLLSELAKALLVGTADHHWIVFIIGGLIGAFLMSIMFRWTLIAFSSLIGSMLILRSFHFGQETSDLLFLCLVTSGIIIQTGALAKKPLRHG